MKKYTPVFGPQELFDGAENCDEYLVAVQHSVGQKTKVSFYPSLVEAFNYVTDFPPRGVVFHRAAMRRIIKEPKCWTVEDKKAGRLPEIGSIFTYRNETLTCHFIDDNGEVWAHDIDNKIVTPLLRDCQPIETPEERAQRLRSEWVKHALDLYMSSPKNDVASMGDVYDALLSGELPPVQAKDGA